MKKEIKEILETLENNGYQAYLVGGYVRDYLLGIKSDDVDIATSATPDEIIKCFPQDEISGDKHFGNINIRGMQITTFRKDTYEENNRFPQVTFTKEIAEDVLRRDFKINALYMDKDENIIDVLDGIDDLNNHKIDTVGDALKSFSEDPLRMIRAIRFMKQLNFELTEEVKTAIKSLKHLLKTISMERIKREIEKTNTLTLKDIDDLLKNF